MGAFGEALEDLHELIQNMAENKVKIWGLKRGSEASDAEVVRIVGQIRRTLSTKFVRAQAQCLLLRMNCVGKGFAEAAKRRK